MIALDKSFIYSHDIGIQFRILRERLEDVTLKSPGEFVYKTTYMTPFMHIPEYADSRSVLSLLLDQAKKSKTKVRFIYSVDSMEKYVTCPKYVAQEIANNRIENFEIRLVPAKRMTVDSLFLTEFFILEGCFAIISWSTSDDRLNPMFYFDDSGTLSALSKLYDRLWNDIEGDYWLVGNGFLTDWKDRLTAIENAIDGFLSDAGEGARPWGPRSALRSVVTPRVHMRYCNFTEVSGWKAFFDQLPHISEDIASEQSNEIRIALCVPVSDAFDGILSSVRSMPNKSFPVKTIVSVATKTDLDNLLSSLRQLGTEVNRLSVSVLRPPLPNAYVMNLLVTPFSASFQIAALKKADSLFGLSATNLTVQSDLARCFDLMWNANSSAIILDSGRIRESAIELLSKSIG